MQISIQEILELVIVVTTIKLIVSRYQPPVQESVQALICIAIGTGLALFVNPTAEGFVTGILGSGIAFYGADLLDAFKKVKDDLTEFNGDTDIK